MNKKDRTRNFTYGITAVAITGTLGYFWWRNKKKMVQSEEQSPAKQVEAFRAAIPPRATVARKSDGFPLGIGSRGPRVELLQRSLNKTFGAGLDEDGIYGPKTLAAVRASGQPISMGESRFNELTKADGLTSIDAKEIADGLHDSIWGRGKDFNRTVMLLNRINGKEAYRAVNAFFKDRDILFTKYTLVTALLRFFPTKKAELSEIFKKVMGLNVNGAGIWSFDGLGMLGREIVTLRDTAVWDGMDRVVNIPGNTLLGNEVSSANGFTHFLTRDRKDLIVHTNAVGYA